MLDVYASFAQDYMAMPVLKGVKSENERFAGAIETYCIEALMQDGKALQAGTSHFLGQNFAKAFDVTFSDSQGKSQHVWATSWGVSTRLMGALIMTHSDDYGLVLPPKLAPIHVAIVPIYKGQDQLNEISKVANTIASKLRDYNIKVKYDDDDKRKPGWKFAEYEMKGVPLRIAIGPRDLENGTVELARRDSMEKTTENQDGIEQIIIDLLDQIQNNLFNKAENFTKKHTYKAENLEELNTILENNGGFVLAHWDGTKESELKIKEKSKATIRCIQLDASEEIGSCICSGKPSSRRVVFARAY